MTGSPPETAAAEDQRPPGQRPPALLLVGHGTRSQAGAAEYFALADRIRARHPWLTVGCGFIELAAPPVSTAVGDLVAGWCDDIVVVPLVLFDAGHAKTDVPASVNLARRQHPGVRFRYGRGLGVHPEMLRVCEERLAATVTADERDEVAVLVVGRGSSDPDANAELHRVARLLWERGGYQHVEPAYVGLTGPRVPEGLDRLHRLGATRVVVLSYFLFTGVLEERIRAQTADFAAATPDVTVTAAGYLGPDDRIADLVVDRYREAVHGPVPRSCDTCVHRVAFPGFEDEVGAPLTPHHHPDDPHTHAPAGGHGAALPAPAGGGRRAAPPSSRDG